MRLLPLAEQLLMMGALNTQLPKARPDKTQQVIYGFAGVLALVAVIFMILAMSYWLKEQYSPDVAALGTAGITLTFSLLVAACGYTYSVLRKSKIHAVGDELKDKIMSALEAMSEEMEDPIRDHPKSSVALATLAGYVIGNRVL
jgi:hypothetical protein